MAEEFNPRAYQKIKDARIEAASLGIETKGLRNREIQQQIGQVKQENDVNANMAAFMARAQDANRRLERPPAPAIGSSFAAAPQARSGGDKGKGGAPNPGAPVPMYVFVDGVIGLVQLYAVAQPEPL